MWSRPPSDDEIFIFVDDDKKVVVEAIETFRLQLKTEFYLRLLLCLFWSRHISYSGSLASGGGWCNC